MVPYLILEENLGPWQAIKRSWKITKHKAANLFALNIIIGVVNIL
jgi:membrane-anchored glycerophosphoryl diester phosphodiesterase (GDPDase)